MTVIYYKKNDNKGEVINDVKYYFCSPDQTYVMLNDGGFVVLTDVYRVTTLLG